MRRTRNPMPDADIYQGDQLVGHFERRPTGIRLSFLDGVTLRNGRLATTLPTGTTDFADLPSYFLNLLPEGARLKLLLESARSSDDPLELLLRVGWDTIGDVAVVPHGSSPKAQGAKLKVKKLSEVRFWDLFHEGVSEDADSAVPGVQEKISAATVTFGVKTPGLPTAILKLNPPKYPLLVHNESSSFAWRARARSR